MFRKITSSDLRAKILNLAGKSDYQPLTVNEITSKLKLPPSVAETLEPELEKMELEGLITRIRQDRWVKPEDAELITGVLQVHEKGFAFLVSEHSEEDIFVAAEDTATAMHQDLVVVRYKKDRPPQGRDRRRKEEPSKRGRVIRILKRRRTTMVGTLQHTGNFHYVVPDDPRYIQNIYVPTPQAPYQTGDMVVVKFLKWESRHINPEGVLVERLGRPGDPGVDILAIIRKHDLPGEFPSEALAELADFAHPEGDASDSSGSRRRDLRQELIITIDPASAKDFDDAIHVKPLGSGRWEVGIHIADVAHYVQPGSALDQEARLRGNSVYLVDQVIPMLPEELSNGLCSLKPHVDRLAYSVVAEVNADGQWKRPNIFRSIIHSKRRFTYEEAFAILQRNPQGEIETLVHRAWEAAASLRAARMKNGSFDLDMPEVKVRLDEQNVPIAIERVEHDISHQLIEEFMLLANEIVATQLTRNKVTGIYRVHEPPDPEKLNAYRELLKVHGIHVGNLENRTEIQKALKKIEGRPEAHALKVGLLRSMKKADYRTKCIGHYGLAKPLYTHFTSPIRRYADLIVHRALADRKSLPSKGQMDQVAAHISSTERTASDAEMESVKLKKLQFFLHEAESDSPTHFDAIIMDVQNFGIFVELPDALMSGLVHVSTLDDDFYHFQQRELNFRGRKTGKIYAVGDIVKVVVDRIDLFKQQIDFKIISAERGKSGKSGKRGKRGQSGQTGKSGKSGDRGKNSRRGSGNSSERGGQGGKGEKRGNSGNSKKSGNRAPRQQNEQKRGGKANSGDKVRGNYEQPSSHPAAKQKPDSSAQGQARPRRRRRRRPEPRQA